MISNLGSDIERDRAFLESVKRRPKGFTWGGTFPEVCALIMGYDRGAKSGLIMDGFQRWLGERRGRPELLYWHHVLAEVVVDRKVRSALDLTVDEDVRATAQLFDWLQEYLDDRSAAPT